MKKISQPKVNKRQRNTHFVLVKVFFESHHDIEMCAFNLQIQIHIHTENSCLKHLKSRDIASDVKYTYIIQTQIFSLIGT